MMNHDGSQQYTFGYGLATTPQIQQLQQQQQQIQLQQHFQQQQSQHSQILQQQGNPAAGIPTQNVFQVQVGGNPTAILQQQNDNIAAAASPTIVQHAGLIQQPVIHASISVSLDNTINKPLQVQCLNNSVETAMVYPQPHQSNGLKIITNSSGFMQQQQQPEIHFQSLATADNLGNSATGSGIFDGITGSSAVVATQNNIGNAFGKQTLSGWVHGDVSGGGNQQQQQQFNVGQGATLPSFGHLWSQFQQQKTQVNIIQQQQQQQQHTPLQVHQFQSPHAHLAQQPSQQFTVSGMQNVNNIQMIKVQQTPNTLQDQHSVLRPAGATATHLFQSCANPVQQNVILTASQHASISSPLPQIACLSSSSSSLSSPSFSQSSTATLVSADPTRNVKEAGVVRQSGSVSLSGVSIQNNSSLVSTKKSSKSLQRKLKSSSQDVISTPPSSSSNSTFSGTSTSTDNAVRIRPSNRKALSESGPPKVTVTLDSLPSSNNLTQFPEKTDSLQQAMKMTAAEKTSKLSPRNQHSSGSKFERNQSSLAWQQHQMHSSALPEKKKLIASNHLTSSTGSSLDRPSSEDSNFSSPPYSFTPPGSIDSVFSPPPHKDISHLAVLNSADIFLPTLPSLSSVKSTNSSPPPSIATTSATVNTTCSLEVIKNSNNLPSHSNKLIRKSSESQSFTDGILPSAMSPPISQPSLFTNSLMSASCCSIAITTTSVTSSSPRTNKCDIAVAASVHSFLPLSSPGISSGSKSHHQQMTDSPNTKKVDDHHSHDQRQVRVPYSWQRNLEDGVIVYLSPSGAVLTSLDEIRDYLLSQDTCKCGLECPFQLEEVFIFDPEIDSIPWCDVVGNSGTDSNPIGNLCNHRREILAMAAFHQSQSHARQVLAESDNARGRKREGRRSLGSVEDFVISPLKKLRTSITNAVNKHALLRNNTSPANSCRNQPSPMSELENTWARDDNVFFPISTNLNTNFSTASNNNLDSSQELEESCPSQTASDFLTSRCLKEGERQKYLNNSENLVYSNHHPSQRLGSKGVFSHHQDGNLQNLQLNSTLHSQSSTFSPHTNAGDSHLCHNQSPPVHQNQKNLGRFLHHSNDNNSNNNNNNNSDYADKESEVSSPSLFGYDSNDNDNNNNSGILQHEVKHSANNGKFSSNYETGIHLDHNRSESEDKNELHSLQLPLSALPSSSTPSSLSTVSFFENPTVFVAQQTAMINNSISSCNINSPSPGFLDDSESLVERKGNDNNKPLKKSSIFMMSEDEEEGGDENNLDTSREEDEEHKGNTDLESNKSFSDTTENNDSAYLSQTGSDQEKSDTVDGLDCISKSSDVYDFNMSEEQLGNGINVRGLKKSLSDQKMENFKIKDSGIDISVNNSGEIQFAEDESGKEKFVSVTKIPGNKSSKLKQNRTSASSKKKAAVIPGMVSGNCLLDTPCALSTSFNKPESSVFVKESANIEKFDTSMCSMGSLNRDLSQLLASNNWNIPALQKVLAQHSAGDPEHLRQVIQQMMTQITTPNHVSYPVSKGPVNSSHTDTVSNMAAAFLNKDAKEETAFDNLKEKSTNSSIDRIDSKLVKGSSCEAKVLPDFGKEKLVVQNSVAKGKVGQMSGQAGGLTPITGPALVNVNRKHESSAKPSPSTLRNNNKGLVQSTIASASAASPTAMTPSSIITTTPTPQQQCSNLQTSIILNTVKSQPAQVMSISSNNTNSASTSTVINVSKPLQMTQVIQNNLTGINQNTAVLPTQPFLGTCAPSAQPLLNHNPSTQNSPQQQIMNMSVNSLSLPGLNNPQLFISNNPIQQASPSSVATAQLSPAIAAAAAAGQILAAQSQQQHQQSALQQQMSPSFIPTAQLPKPCSASISSLALPNNASAIPIASGNNPAGVTDVPQGPTAALAGNVITGPPQNSAAVVAAANASVYSAATNPPVFVIPQAKAVQPPPAPPPVMQLVGGSSQTINSAANGLQGGDINMNQILNQISADQSQQLQNLINAASASGFNPAAAAALGGIQQQPATWNTVNLNTQQQQQQQQQQLQLLQLQQLMLPAVLGNQNQALPNVSMCCPTQTNTLMNAMVGHQGLQINQVVDVKAIQQNLTPTAATAQGFNNPGLSPVAAQTAFSNQIQQMASPLTVQVGSAATNQTISTINPQVSLSKPISILQPQPQQQQQPSLQTCASTTSDPGKKNLTQQSVSVGSVSKINIAAQPSQTVPANTKIGDKEVAINAPVQAQPQQNTSTTTVKSPVIVSNGNVTNPSVLTKSTSTTTSKPNSSKSKSKSKKSDNTKVKDPQAAKDEEHIANAVNQILAQAVQQQRELTLAAQNAPPPPPKSRNRKRDSQARARQAAAAQAAAAAALQQAKEQELGKIASISDDAVFHHPLQPPKALPLHTPPVQNFSSLSSPLSSSSSSSSSSLSSPSSFSSTTPVMNRQEPPSPSLSHLVNSNDNINTNDSDSAIHSSLNQFAMLSSSQSRNSIAVKPNSMSPSSTVSHSHVAQLPPTLLSPSESVMVCPAPPALPSDLSPPSSQTHTARLISIPSSTIAAVSSVSCPSTSKSAVSTSKTMVPGINQPTHQYSVQNPSSLPTNVQVDRTNCGNVSQNITGNINTTNNSNNNNNSIGKNKNTATPSLLPADASTVNDNNLASFRKSPISFNPLSNLGISNSNNISPSSSSSSSSITPKKSSISLKEHLSSIVFSKDKESGKKKSTATTTRSMSNDKACGSAANVANPAQSTHLAGKGTKLSSATIKDTNTNATKTISTLNLSDAVINGESSGINIGKSGRQSIANDNA